MTRTAVTYMRDTLAKAAMRNVGSPKSERRARSAPLRTLKSGCADVCQGKSLPLSGSIVPVTAQRYQRGGSKS